MRMATTTGHLGVIFLSGMVFACGGGGRGSGDGTDDAGGGGGGPDAGGATTYTCEQACSALPGYGEACTGEDPGPVGPACVESCSAAPLPQEARRCIVEVDCSDACIRCVQSGTATACSGGSGGVDGGSGSDVAWAGTWSVRVRYRSRCDIGFDNFETKDHDFTVTTAISGPNSDLTADTDGYAMTGTGDGSGMTLSGRFPIRNHNDDVAADAASRNNITLRIDRVVDPSNASGTIEGTFQDNFGNRCSVENGEATISR